MDDSFATYIRMVHHLIEKCLIFTMTEDQCMEALSKHANIEPVITRTVWRELEKENREFFEAYKMNRRQDRIPEAQTTQKILQILSEGSSSSDDTKPSS